MCPRPPRYDASWRHTPEVHHRPLPTTLTRHTLDLPLLHKLLQRGTHATTQQLETFCATLLHLLPALPPRLLSCTLHLSILSREHAPDQLPHLPRGLRRLELPGHTRLFPSQGLLHRPHIAINRLWRQITLALHVRLHAPHSRPRTAHAEAMPVRIPAGARLEARHSHVRGFRRMRYDRRHDDTHQQFRPHSNHVRNQIRALLGERKPLSSIAATLLQRRISLSTPNIHALHIIRCIVVAVHGPPERRMPP